MKRCDCEVAVGENSGGRVNPLPCDLFVGYDRYDYLSYVCCEVEESITEERYFTRSQRGRVAFESNAVESRED